MSYRRFALTILGLTVLLVLLALACLVFGSVDIPAGKIMDILTGKGSGLTFTHLTKEGMPLLRYRTHDLTALHYEKCACGRTLVRMDRILGRCDDMLIIRGVNVFPSQIEDVILKLPEYEPHFLLTVDRVNNTDTSELRVEVKDEYFTDDMATMVGLQKKLESELRSVIGLGFKVKLVEPKGIERSEGKAKRVIDKRKFEK